jgi:sugar phosphate isomerase/epimerase
MRLGYNTNGMAHHELFDAVALLAEIGYGSVAITIDHTALSPYASYGQQRIRRLRALLTRLGMASVIETGGRFLLDPRTKHEPTLVSGDAAQRARRIEFYKYAVDCAAELGSDCVSLWSGAVRGDVAPSAAGQWLREGLHQVLDHAARRQVVAALEPEPGMLIDSMRGFEGLLGQLGRDDLRLTLDVGHVHCQCEGPIAEVIGRWAPRLANVHVEDMRAGVHEHLMFGEGEIDFPPLFRALAQSGYAGGVHVELSRHSHDAPRTARRAMEFLAPMITAATNGNVATDETQIKHG